MINLSATIAGDKYMTTFVSELKTAGMEQILDGDGPFTVFVPTNLSFGKINSSVLQKWEKSEHQAELKTLLNHHIVIGKINFAELTNGSTLNTVDGQKLSVQIIGKKVMINHAEVLGRDIQASNGIIHSIDRVIQNN